MEVTRGYWAIVGVGLFLTISAVALAQPVLLIGAVVLWGWLLGTQYLFVREAGRIRDGSTVTITSSRNRVVTGSTIAVTLSGSGVDATSVDSTVTLSVPLGTTDTSPEERTIPLETEPTVATISLEWPIAGQFEISPVEHQLVDQYGLFRQRFEYDIGPSITVDPRRPRNVHIGSGGEEIGSVYGEHDAGRLGSGIEPAELRQYLPGDATRHIDWKATARLNEPYVREQEATTDRQTIVIVDHRDAVNDGPTGETKLDYLRHVALAFVNSAEDIDDPLGLYTVGDEGTTTSIRPATDSETYERIRTTVRGLTPTPKPGQESSSTNTGTQRPSEPGGAEPIGDPAAARRAAQRFSGEETQMAAMMRPFLEASETYIQRIDREPLFRTVRTHRKRIHGAVWTVIFSDDTHRAELQETVKLARGSDDHVLVFLTPSALFNTDGMSALSTAYEQYLEFEEFRRGLDQLDRVSAFEVAPGDRLDAVLADSRKGRRGRNATTEPQGGNR